MSLRARLLVALLALATIGMLIFGFASHTALRSYLTDRVDQQVQAASFPVIGQLVSEAVKDDQLPRFPVERTRPAAGEDAPALGDVQLPPGTYGELRGARGKVISRTTFSYGEEGLPEPEIPDALAAGDAEADPVTVGAVSGSTEFRVASFSLPENRGRILIAVPLTELEETLDRLAAIEAIVGAAVLALLAALGWWVIRLGLRPLEQMEASAGEIASGQLSRRVEPATERTEVGRLGLALNAMLRQIETAFDERTASENRLRAFLADASHELRTPLSSIRGYSELFRLGAAADPGELEQAMSRIESEATRMGSIVEDLLTLARLDQAPEPERAPVDLVALADEACADAQIAAPARPIAVTGDRRSVEVEGSEDELRQVLANLAGNALRHTPPRSPIEIDVRAESGRALVTVRDHGPGLEPGSEERIFERFWRPSVSRQRRDGGSGLGLAIVWAIVESHGGHVDAANAPGGGAVFTVSLPLVHAKTLAKL